jgi:Tfp pilus assembly PilM family ATPase
MLYILKQEREKLHQMSAEKVEAKEKALEKMTVKDLREMAKAIPEIVGVHGMKKEELILAIKQAKGIIDEPVKKSDASVRELKHQIKDYKAQRRAALEAKDRKMATIYKRRISRLKKKTRRAAV